jgi:hypothetical protein
MFLTNKTITKWDYFFLTQILFNLDNLEFILKILAFS